MSLCTTFHQTLDLLFSSRESPSVDIGEATSGDVRAISDIANLSFSPLYALFARGSLRSLKNVIVCRTNGSIAGVIQWKTVGQDERRISYLSWIAVHPNFRRIGVASQLIGAAVSSSAKEYGPLDVYTAVERDNKPSQYLFRSLGFRGTSRRDVRKELGLGTMQLYFKMTVVFGEHLFVLRREQMSFGGG